MKQHQCIVIGAAQGINLKEVERKAEERKQKYTKKIWEL
jgi:hypothetical protein